jgi:hypothetical protein
LPRLRARILDALTRDDVSHYDHRLAAYFLLPESLDTAPALEWGLDIASAVRADPTPTTRARELSAEFFRLSVAHALPGNLAEPVRFDAELRGTTEATMAGWTDTTRELCEHAAGELWRLMHDPEPRVWRAAMYGIASHPAYVIALESRLAECLAHGEPTMQSRAARLADMLDPGFSPRIDDALA